MCNGGGENKTSDPDENTENMDAHFSARDGEFLLALLTLRGFIVFQPGLTLNTKNISMLRPKRPAALKVVLAARFSLTQTRLKYNPQDFGISTFNQFDH